MSQSTSLMDLPPELRLLIYEHLLGPKGRIYIIFKKRGTLIQIPRLFGWPGGGHGLLLVCRQIRNEFLPIYIESAVDSAREIVIPVKNFNFKRVQRFLALYKDKFQPATNPSLGYGKFYEKEERKYGSLLRQSMKTQLSSEMEAECERLRLWLHDNRPWVVASLYFRPNFEEAWPRHAKSNLEHWRKHPPENYIASELSKKKRHGLQRMDGYVDRRRFQRKTLVGLP
ncbi:hypothetical protein KC318_g3561 [Hortaea werneckii]|nr:hypothetical protein KC334_g15482 [Hortaea werneckii]KAI7017826.1 hypothetical protein KC355_g3547 [Hortaea werneckii]KAI7671320.1 hypothetical protein KC318_g3561 [Hortaea werneckii]